MAETQGSDMGKGLVLVFGAITALAAIAVTASSYSAALSEHGETMQLYSGVFLAVAFVAAGIAVAAVHLYD